MSRQFSGGVNAGRLTDLLVFQLKTITVNGQGQSSPAWGVGFNEWGEAQRQSEQNCRFIIRHRLTTTGERISAENSRIVYDDSIWTITNSVPDRQRTMLIIDSDFSALLEATHMLSTEREYVEGIPIVRPPE